MSKHDGGPAFPFTPHAQQMLPNGTWDQSYDPGESGMTLRDYFAAKAMHGLIAGRSWAHIENDDDKIRAWAEGAYAVADAMLAARGQSHE